MNGTEDNIYGPTTGIGGQDQDGDVKGGAVEIESERKLKEPPLPNVQSGVSPRGSSGVIDGV